MKYYLDEDITDRVSRALRDRGVEAISSHECGRNSLPDEEQLQLAAMEGRVFVTRNRDDFILQSQIALENETPHIGVVIVGARFSPQQIGLLVNALITFAEAHPDGMTPYTFEYLKPG